jgi:hypothetical protein
MPSDVFVDESVRNDYVLCAVRVDPRDLRDARSFVRSLRLGGERRIHFSKESNQRRRELLARLCDHGFDVSLYRAPAHDPLARARLLTMLVEDHGGDLHRLVLESRGAGDVADQRHLIDLRRSGLLPDTATYEHLRPHEEPMLWVADAIAWSYGATGDWKRRIEAMLTAVRQYRP